MRDVGRRASSSRDAILGLADSGRPRVAYQRVYALYGRRGGGNYFIYPRYMRCGREAERDGGPAHRRGR